MGRRRRQRPLPSRIRGAVRAFLAFLFSNVGTVMLVIGYTIAGAFMFQAIEGAREMEQATLMARERERTVQHLWNNVTLVVNPLDEREIKQRVDHELQRYQRGVVAAVRRGWDAGRRDGSRQWSFSNAFLYSMTVITTIGYGHLSPRTAWGKVTTILYALLGMPLFLLYLSNVGSLFARWFKCVYALVCHCRGCPGFRTRPGPLDITHTHHLEISDSESIERPVGWRRYSDSDLSSHSPNVGRRQRHPTHPRHAMDGDTPYRIREVDEYQRSADHRSNAYRRYSNDTNRSPTGDRKRAYVQNSYNYHKSDNIANRHTLPKDLRYFPLDFREGNIKTFEDRRDNRKLKDMKNRRQNSYRESQKLYEIQENCTGNETDVPHPFSNFNHHQRVPSRNASSLRPGTGRMHQKQFIDPHEVWHVETPIYPMIHPSNITSQRIASDAYKHTHKVPDESIDSDSLKSSTRFTEQLPNSARHSNGSSQLPKARSWTGTIKCPEPRPFRSRSSIAKNEAAYRPVSLNSQTNYEEEHFSSQFLRSQSLFPRNENSHRQTSRNYLPSYPKYHLNRSYSEKPRSTALLKGPAYKDYQRRAPHQYWSEILDKGPWISDDRRYLDDRRNFTTIPRYYSTRSTSRRNKNRHFASYRDSRYLRVDPERAPIPEYWPHRLAEVPWSGRQRGWSEPVHPSSVSSEFSHVTFDPQTITVPISVCVAIMVGYLIFGSMIFGLWEQWDLLDGAYFCFISLTSIGFGDIVPGERIYTPRVETSFIVCSLYLMLGMALVAMCFNLMQEQVIHYFAGLRRAFKRTCQCLRCWR